MSLNGDIEAAFSAGQMVSQGHSSAPGWQQQIAWMWPSPPGQNMLVRSSLSRFGTGGNMRAPPQIQQPNVLQQTQRQRRIKKEATYVVGLIPGVTGLVHLCYMPDRYHLVETLSKDVSCSASRPEGEQGELWLVYKAPLTEIQYLKKWCYNYSHSQ